jgi:hypothetical protein
MQLVPRRGFVARKDLSRTVIEGGRYYSNCFFRRASHGDHRASTREWLDRVAYDVEYADEHDPPPLVRVRKQFRDKLGPAMRWLRSQVGRPWDNVYADLCARFDTRTIAGRHVVHDHMLPSVRQFDDPRWHHRSDLVIDAHGILREPAFFGVSWRKLRDRAKAWAQGRVAASTYRGWWWFRVDGIGPRCLLGYGCAQRHFMAGTDRYHAVRYTGDRPLSRKARAYLDRLPADIRQSIVIPSPL